MLVFEKTKKLYSKQKNGDHVITEILPEEELIILVVADGVGGRPCDWKASKITCTKVVNQFKLHSGLEMTQRIEKSVLAVNEILLQEAGDCDGLCSTLSLVVWNYSTQQCWMVNVGDSRVVKLSVHFEQISSDDSDNSGKLTAALGWSSLKFEVNEIAFSKGETLVLMTDGFYTAEPNKMESDLMKLDGAEFVSYLDEVFDDYSWMAKDDMTIAAIHYS